MTSEGKFTKTNIFGAILGGLSGLAIGIAEGSPLATLLGGAFIGFHVSQWIGDKIRNKQEKPKHV